jgi:hypothetical protein
MSDTRLYQQQQLLKEIDQVERLMTSITERLQRLKLLDGSDVDVARAQGMMISVTSRLRCLELPEEDDILPGE